MQKHHLDSAIQKQEEEEPHKEREVEHKNTTPIKRNVLPQCTQGKAEGNGKEQDAKLEEKSKKCRIDKS